MGLIDLVKEDLKEKDSQMLKGSTPSVTSEIKVASAAEFLSNFNKLTSRLNNEVKTINEAIDTISNNKRNREQEEIKEKKYQDALKLYNAESYSEALSTFDSLGFYKEATSYVSKCRQKIKEVAEQKKRDKERQEREKREAEDRAERSKAIAKIVIPILVIVGIVAGITITSKVKKAAKEAAIDLKNMSAEVASLNCYYNQYEERYSNGCYHIEIYYDLTNNTGVDWCYLKLVTNVYLNGSSIGTITTQFGEQYNGSSGFRINVGESMTKSSELTCGIKENDDFFETIYDNYSNLEFDTQVTYGTYYED